MAHTVKRPAKAGNLPDEANLNYKGRSRPAKVDPISKNKIKLPLYIRINDEGFKRIFFKKTTSTVIVVTLKLYTRYMPLP